MGIDSLRLRYIVLKKKNFTDMEWTDLGYLLGYLVDGGMVDRTAEIRKYIPHSGNSRFVDFDILGVNLLSSYRHTKLNVPKVSSKYVKNLIELSKTDKGYASMLIVALSLKLVTTEDISECCNSLSDFLSLEKYLEQIGTFLGEDLIAYYRSCINCILKGNDKDLSGEDFLRMVDRYYKLYCSGKSLPLMLDKTMEHIVTPSPNFSIDLSSVGGNVYDEAVVFLASLLGAKDYIVNYLKPRLSDLENNVSKEMWNIAMKDTVIPYMLEMDCVEIERL